MQPANYIRFAIMAAAALLLAACGESTESPRASMDFGAAYGGELSFQTDEGFDVVIDAADFAIADIAFTVGGVAHTDNVEFKAIDQAYHPGHIEGGQVLAELLGERLIQLPEDAETVESAAIAMVPADYDAANFGFWSTDEIGAGTDPVAVEIRGTVTLDGNDEPFRVSIPLDSSDSVLGVPFEETVSTSSTGAVRFRFHPVDPLEGDTFLDGVPFDELSSVGDELLIEPNTTAFNRVRNAIRSHDHYSFTLD